MRLRPRKRNRGSPRSVHRMRFHSIHPLASTRFTSQDLDVQHKLRDYIEGYQLQQPELEGAKGHVSHVVCGTRSNRLIGSQD